jgi:hypothetical protein
MWAQNSLASLIGKRARVVMGRDTVREYAGDLEDGHERGSYSTPFQDVLEYEGIVSQITEKELILERSEKEPLILPFAKTEVRWDFPGRSYEHGTWWMETLESEDTVYRFTLQGKILSKKRVLTFTPEEFALLSTLVGKQILVTSAHESYEFSSKQKHTCGGRETRGRSGKLLRVDPNGIVLEDNKEIEIRISDCRSIDTAFFFSDNNTESYWIDFITEITLNGQVIFHKGAEDYMPADIKEKRRTYKHMIIPPDPAEDE